MPRIRIYLAARLQPLSSLLLEQPQSQQRIETAAEAVLLMPWLKVRETRDWIETIDVRSRVHIEMGPLEERHGRLLNLDVEHISLHREAWHQEPATGEGMVLLVGAVQVQIMAREEVISRCPDLGGMVRVEVCLVRDHQAMVLVLMAHYRVKDNMNRTMCHKCLRQERPLNPMGYRTLL